MIIAFGVAVFAIVFLTGVVGLLCRVVTVPEGRRAILLQFGRFSRVLKPGAHVLWAGVHKLHVFRHRGTESEFVSIYRQRLMSVGDVSLRACDSIEIRVRLIMHVRVDDVRRFAYSAEDPLQSVLMRVEDALQREAQEHTKFTDVVAQLRASNCTLPNGLYADTLSEFGVQLNGIETRSMQLPREMQDVAHTDATLRLEEQLDRQRAEVRHAWEELNLAREHALELRRLDMQTELNEKRRKAELADIAALLEETGCSLDSLAAWRAANRSTPGHCGVSATK